MKMNVAMSKPTSLHVAIAQINPCVGNFDANKEKILNSIDEARDNRADLVVFPEMVVSGYPPEDLLFRPAFLQHIEDTLEDIRQASTDITVIIGAPKYKANSQSDNEKNRLYNMAVVFQNNELIAEYAKQKLPNYRVFDEKRYFSHGKETLIVEVSGVKTAILICEDIWQNEPIALAKERGAEAIVVLNASPFRYNKALERQALLERHAGQHRLAIIYANLVGGQDELVFDGHSLVVDSHAQLIFQADTFTENTYFVEVPITEKGEKIELELASEEAQTYEALVTGVCDYVGKNGFKGVLLGLSGGIDSALTMAIAVDALGAENVEAIMMPFHYTADISITDASQQAKTQGVKYREIPIETVFDSFMELLSKEFAEHKADVTEENIQARSRGIILMAMSNKMGKMLLATGNKSEMSMGYATLYGDMAGGFAPLKDVYKTLVYKLAQYRNQCGDGEIIPNRVITRPPSAELAPDQKDEDSLPPYDILDEVLRLFIEEFKSVSDIVALGFEQEIVKFVADRVLLNEHKRRQSAPGIRVTKRAFGKDRRYPITSAYRKYL